MERLGPYEIKSYFQLITAYLMISLYQSIKFSLGIMASFGVLYRGQRALRRTYGLFGSNYHCRWQEFTVSLSLETSTTLLKDVPLTTFVHVLPDT
jgi:hypothetical protein